MMQQAAQRAGLDTLVAVQRNPDFTPSTPVDPDSEDTGSPVELRRYVEVLIHDGTHRHRALFPTQGSFLIQLAGVLNTVTEARGLSTRFVAPDGWNILIWGPEDALRDAVGAGVLRVRERSMTEVTTD